MTPAQQAEYVRLVAAETRLLVENGLVMIENKRLLERVRVLRDYALMDANCPCCRKDDVCDDDCAYAHDAHSSEYSRMVAARDALAKVQP